MFRDYLASAGVLAGNLFTDPEAWRRVRWGLVAGFVEWMLHQGYAIGSINVRLSKFKVYARQATKAGALDHDIYT